jgi:hypothetical protein
MAMTRCPGCSAYFPDIAGPTHPYMEPSPGCWAAFGDVLAREYSDSAYFDIHRLSVDSYAVQHPGRPSRQSIQSVGVHLIRLCLFLEHGLTPEKANAAMLAAAQEKHTYTWLEPPESLGATTVADVRSTLRMNDHKQAVRAWSASAWQAWSIHHDTVRGWLLRPDNSFKPKPLGGSA